MIIEIVEFESKQQLERYELLRRLVHLDLFAGDEP
jgi:hypothetical protein